MLIFGIFLDPFQDLTIPFAGGEFLLQRFGIDPFEIQKSVIERAGIMVFVVLPIDCRSAFVEHARQDHISTQAHPGAARWLPGQVRSIIQSHSFNSVRSNPVIVSWMCSNCAFNEGGAEAESPYSAL